MSTKALKKFTAEELQDPKMQPFIRFFGFRPRNFDARFPQYDPSRDYANIAMWLNTVKSFATSQHSAYWQQVAIQLLPDHVEADQTVILAMIDDAYKAFQQFLLDARGGLPLDATEIPADFTIDSFVDFPVALAKLRDVEQAGMVPVLGMLGICAIDMLFYAARSDMALSRGGALTMDEMAPLLQKISFGIWDGEWPEDAAIVNLKEAVRVAMVAGLSSGQVMRIVENETVT